VEPAAATPRADVYGLACTTFMLLTGRPPYDGGTEEDLRRQHADAPPPAPSRHVDELLPFDALFARALAKDPAERPSSAGAFARELAAGRSAVREGAARAGLREAIAPGSGASRRAPESTALRAQGDTRGLDALRVLVADDDDVFRKLASRAVQLGLHGHLLSLSAARSGADAVESAKRRPPQLVLLDQDMPEMSGVETLARLRELPGGADMRVIVVSSRASEADRCHFAALGVREFLDKPVSLPLLVERVTAIAQRAGWRASETSSR